MKSRLLRRAWTIECQGICASKSGFSCLCSRFSQVHTAACLKEEIVMRNINIVNLLLYGVFVLPLLAGFIGSFSKEKVRYTLSSLLDNIEFLAGIILSVYLTKRIFFENDGSVIFKKIYDLVPHAVKTFLYGRDILAYVVSIPVLLLFLLLVFKLVTTPFYNAVIVPLTNKTYEAVNSMGKVAKRIIGALWQLPKSIYLPVLTALLLNFCTYYVYLPSLTAWVNDSTPYKFIYDSVLYPMLNSNIAKKVPVIVNDSFRNTIGKVIGEEGGSKEQSEDAVHLRKIKIIEYFNGVTLDEAVKSTPEIDETALLIVGGETGTKKKARLIYDWVSENIEYDYDKAERISISDHGISSGSIVAFDSRKGICFDYSCLYISMCRAAGLKVRLVTGLAYSGTMWGDHAWNQVYSEEEDRWINLDATFGSSGTDYFDKDDFDVDHKFAQIQGEW